MRYEWYSGGYDYLQSVGMSPRNATIAGYIQTFGRKPYTILDAACGLCPVMSFLPQNNISRYVAFDNSQHVAEHIPYKSLKCFEFYHLSFEEFLEDERFAVGSFDFVMYLGMYGGYDVYAERLKRLLLYAKEDGYIILEAIEEHIAPVKQIMSQQYPGYKITASCNIEIHNGAMSHLTRERFRSINLYRKKGIVV
ncbi:TPA: hypothetical protein EYP66_02490 [Candidatus Poribacteria bacterium]|nr:hypothetical protein [Candidatus Poribacteria bacterium]